MNRTILFILFASLLLSCTQTEDAQMGAPDIRTLYSVTWGEGMDRVALVGSQDLAHPFQGLSRIWLLTSRDGGLKAVKVDRDGVAATDVPCALSTMEQGIGLCDGTLYFPDEGSRASVEGVDEPVSAAPGLMGRLVYLLDRSGTLHVADSGNGARASDDGLLLLYRAGGDRIRILSGNGRTAFVEHTLPGAVMAHAVADQVLHLAWYDEARHVMGIDTIDLLDMDSVVVGRECVVAAAPSALALTDDGMAAVTFVDGAAPPLMIDPAFGVVENLSIANFESLPDRVFSLPGSDSLYFWSSDAGTLTRLDILTGQVLRTQVL